MMGQQAMATPPRAPIRGAYPTIFDGERNKTLSWNREFNNWQRVNRETYDVSSPYQRTALALSLMRGPNIEDWAAQEGEKLDAKLTA